MISLLLHRLRRNEEEKNEILQLYERMRRENEDRRRENEALKDLLYQVGEYSSVVYVRITTLVTEY